MKDPLNLQTIDEIMQYGVKVDVSTIKQDDPFMEQTPLIYFVFNKELLVYIGQTTSLMQRLYSHKNRSTIDEFDSIYSIPCDKDLLTATEKSYIQQFHPPCNLNATHRAKRKLVSLRINSEIFINLKVYSSKHGIPYGVILEGLVDAFTNDPSFFPKIDFFKYK